MPNPQVVIEIVSSGRERVAAEIRTLQREAGQVTGAQSRFSQSTTAAGRAAAQQAAAVRQADRALLSLRSSLSGTERATAQTARATQQLNQAYAAGRVGVAEYLRLQERIAQRFTATTATASLQRQAIQGLAADMTRLAAANIPAGGFLPSLAGGAAGAVGLGVTAGAVGAAGLGAASFGIARAGENLQMLQFQLQALGGSAATVDRLRDSSLALGTAFADNVDMFRRLLIANDNLGKSQDELVAFTARLNQALVISGASGVQASAGLLQLGQALASGRAQGDEFRSMAENIPAVLQAIGRGLVDMGVASRGTVGELRELGTQGELTSERIFEGFMRGSQDLEEVFERMPQTTGRSLQRISDGLGEILADLGLITGATQGWQAALAQAATNIQSILPFVREWRRESAITGGIFGGGPATPEAGRAAVEQDPEMAIQLRQDLDRQRREVLQNIEELEAELAMPWGPVLSGLRVALNENRAQLAVLLEQLRAVDDMMAEQRRALGEAALGMRAGPAMVVGRAGSATAVEHAVRPGFEPAAMRLGPGGMSGRAGMFAFAQEQLDTIVEGNQEAAKEADRRREAAAEAAKALPIERERLQFEIAARGQNTEQLRIQLRLLEAREQFGAQWVALHQAEIVAVEKLRSARDDAAVTQRLEQEVESGRLRVQYAGQETEEYRIQAAILQTRQQNFGRITAEQEQAIREREAARSEEAALVAERDLGDQLEDLRLSVQYVGQETEQYRIQKAELELKRQLLRDELTPAQREQIRAVEAERTALEQVTAERERQLELRQLQLELEFSGETAMARAIGASVPPEEFRVQQQLETLRAGPGGEAEAARQEPIIREIEATRTQLALIEDLQTAADNFTDTLASGFAEAIVQGEDLNDVLDDMLRSLLQTGLQEGFATLFRVGTAAAIGAFAPGPAAAGGPVGGPAIYGPGTVGPGGMLGHAQHGFSGTVPGSGPADSRLFMSRVSPGEHIEITPAANLNRQAAAMSRMAGTGGNRPNIQFQVINQAPNVQVEQQEEQQDGITILRAFVRSEANAAMQDAFRSGQMNSTMAAFGARRQAVRR